MASIGKIVNCDSCLLSVASYSQLTCHQRAQRTDQEESENSEVEIAGEFPR